MGGALCCLSSVSQLTRRGNVMLEMQLGLGSNSISPTGQQQWVIPGTYQWVCPPGVFSVCALLIAAGGNGGVVGTTPSGGYGGGCRWQNNIPVVPGEVYTIVVGDQGPTVTGGARARNLNSVTGRSSALGLVVGQYSTGTPLDANVGGGWGGTGSTYMAGGSNVAPGGYAGLYTNGNTPSRSGANDGKGVKGAQLIANAFSTTIDYGGGGNGLYNYASIAYTYVGAPGAVRLIWGEGRGYPATKITNQ